MSISGTDSLQRNFDYSIRSIAAAGPKVLIVDVARWLNIAPPESRCEGICIHYRDLIKVEHGITQQRHENLYNMNIIAIPNSFWMILHTMNSNLLLVGCQYTHIWISSFELYHSCRHYAKCKVHKFANKINKLDLLTTPPLVHHIQRRKGHLSNGKC